MTWDTLILLGVILISLTLLTDIIFPSCFQEGFTINASDNPFLSAYFPRRGDVSFNTEEAGYIQDKRHVMGYADVQGLGVNHDFCRMVKPKGADDSKKFFACALGGTENLASTKFQTLTIENGFLTSRDDYMRDASNDTKSDYCAVVKMPSGAWEPQCYKALPTSFKSEASFRISDPFSIVSSPLPIIPTKTLVYYQEDSLQKRNQPLKNKKVDKLQHSFMKSGMEN